MLFDDPIIHGEISCFFFGLLVGLVIAGVCFLVANAQHRRERQDLVDRLMSESLEEYQKAKNAKEETPCRRFSAPDSPWKGEVRRVK